MSQVNLDTLEKNIDSVLEQVGKDSYVNWEEFSSNSSEVAKSIEELNQSLAIFRELQHKNFIQTMKKLKSYDLPDLLQAVKNKKLPKEALRNVLNRFKLNGDKLELVEPAQNLKENAQNDFSTYTQKNKDITEQIKKVTESLKKRMDESGLMPTNQSVPELQKIKSTVKFNLSEDTASNLASKVEIQYLPGTNKCIGYKTYSQILDHTFTLIKDQYKKITEQARVQQRKNSTDYPKYLKIMNEYLMNCEALIIQGQSLIGTKVGVTEQKIAESQMALMERGMGNNILLLQSQLRAKIKESVKSDKDVSMDVAKQVIRYQVEMIDKKSSQINDILKNMQKGPETIQTVPMLLALILNDYVFQKYGYEEEDFMKNLNEEIMTNPEFIQVFKDMEIGIMKLMQNLDIIPPEVAEMMKQQQQMMSQMGGMMPGMQPPGMIPGMQGPPPGMMPGNNQSQSNNPMDMLQMQQMMQMQQMFQNMGMQPPK